MDFVAGQPGGILERLADIRGLKVRVVSEDLVVCGAVCDLADDERDRNPHASYTGATAHDVRLEGDTIKHRRLRSVALNGLVFANLVDVCQQI